MSYGRLPVDRKMERRTSQPRLAHLKRRRIDSPLGAFFDLAITCTQGEALPNRQVESREAAARIRLIMCRFESEDGEGEM